MAKTKAEEMVALGAVRPADPLNIPLGSEVYDVITSLQGCITQRIEAPNGNIRYGVQPPGDGNVIPEAINLDYHTLLMVGPGCSAVATPVINPTSIKLGEKVREKVSGFEGIVNGKIVFLNGCEYLEVSGRATDKHPQGPVCVCQSQFWEKIGDGLNVKPKEAKPPQERLGPPRGGPMTRIVRPTAFRG